MNSRCKVLLALIAFAAMPAGARAATASASCPTPAPEAVQKAAVAVPVAGGSTLQLRIADTYAKREYGLMCVRSVEHGSGMIFVFADGDQKREFWMKNTLIPLDMVWVNKDGRVTSVAANVPATTVDTPDEKIPRRSGTGTYVIELGTGDAARQHIAAGARLDVTGIAPAKE